MFQPASAIKLETKSSAYSPPSCSRIFSEVRGGVFEGQPFHLRQLWLRWGYQ